MERLRIRIHHDKLDTFNLRLNHTRDGVTPRSADTDDFYFCKGLNCRFYFSHTEKVRSSKAKQTTRKERTIVRMPHSITRRKIVSRKAGPKRPRKSRASPCKGAYRKPACISFLFDPPRNIRQILSSSIPKKSKSPNSSSIHSKVSLEKQRSLLFRRPKYTSNAPSNIQKEYSVLVAGTHKTYTRRIGSVSIVFPSIYFRCGTAIP